MIPELSFRDMLDFTSSDNHMRITLDTSGKVMKISEILFSEYISIWIGPEGGWSDNEREKMIDSGFLFVRL